jgi:D-arginine dehydrogenase
LDVEVVIVGAGIAGASLAYFLAEAGQRSVLLIEREAQPARHASGRSAEALVEVELGDPTWQPLLAESARFFRSPPPAVARRSLVIPTGIVNLVDESERAVLEAALPGLRESGIAIELLAPAETLARLPFISEREFAGALLLPHSGRLAVGALMSGYLGAARARGAELWLDTAVLAVETAGGRVSGVETSRGRVGCRLLVCAAGAWAGALGRMAAATPVELAPLRRTVVSFDPPPGFVTEGLPLLSYDARGVYLATEGHGLIASPMDEDPVPPCDATADPAQIELALERLGRLAAPLVPRRITAARAGLRTFAPDRRLVIGEDPARPGFFWLAGQGGTGIETSPAVGRFAAALLTGGAVDRELAAALSPVRFAPTRL